MAVDLTTGSYDEDGIFSKHNEEPTKLKAEDNFCSLKNFRTVRVLKENESEKMLAVEGRFVGDSDPAIVVVEKMHFDVRDLPRLFSSDTRLELKFRNNIYANYHVYPSNGFNGIDVKVIHPAKDEDFAKFVDEPMVMVHESFSLYEKVVLPHLKAVTSEQNFIENNAEKVIYKSTEENAKFTLFEDIPEFCFLPKEHVHAVCFVQEFNLVSLRDLTPVCVPLLVKVKKKCEEALASKYGISSSKLESYIQYPPSRLPFHIFFVSVEKDKPLPTELGHDLSAIICNIELLPDYYKKVTLTYSLSKNSPLLTKIKNINAESNCNENSKSG